MDKFSLYLPKGEIKPFQLNSPTRNIEPEEFYEIIRSGEIQLEEILYLRTLVTSPELKKENKHEYTSKKESLAGNRMSGTFVGGKNDDNMIAYSNRIVLDLDNLYEHLDAIKQIVEALPFVESVFKSVGGQGLAVVVPVDLKGKEPSKETHRQLFFALEKYFHGILKEFFPDPFDDRSWIDASCKNLSRFRYVSFDPDIYVNMNAERWTGMLENSVRPKKPKKSEAATIEIKLETPVHVSSTNLKETAIRTAVEMISTSTDGELHACRAKAGYYLGGHVGAGTLDAIEAYDALSQAVKDRGTTNLEKALATIRGQINEGRKKPLDLTPVVPSTPPQQNQQIWWTLLFNAKQEFKGFGYSVKKYIEWLSSEYGIYRHTMPNGNRVVVQCKDGILTELNKDSLYDILKPYFDSQHDELSSDIILSSTRKREFLDPIYGLVGLAEVESTGRIWDFRDRNSEYLFFQNVIIQITADGKKSIKYKNFKGLIWDSQVIHRDFKPVETPGDFERFVKNISGAGYNSFRSGLGYMMHSYKDPSDTVFVLIHDQNLGNAAEGGTGKSIVCKVLKYYKSMTTADGRAVRSDDRFIFEDVREDTQVLLIDDLHRGFVLNIIYNKITGDWEINKKGLSKYTIPFEKSPKAIGTTNYTIKKEGNSDNRRLFSLEATKYYGPHLSVHSDFGHNLYTDWVGDLENEWNKCDNFMIGCVSLYLADGLIPQEFVALKEKEFNTECGEEFIAWMDSLIETGEVCTIITHPFETVIRHSKTLLRKSFLNYLIDNKLDMRYYSNVSVNKFWERVERWAKFRHFEIDEVRSGANRLFRIFSQEKIREYLDSKMGVDEYFTGDTNTKIPF